MISFLLNNNLAPIGSSVISTCSPADLFEQRERNVSLASADVLGGGRLHDEPKERLRRRLCSAMLCYAMLCSALRCSTQRYSTLCYCTLLCSTLLYAILLSYSILLYSTICYATLLYYSTLLYSTVSKQYVMPL